MSGTSPRVWEPGVAGRELAPGANSSGTAGWLPEAGVAMLRSGLVEDVLEICGAKERKGWEAGILGYSPVPPDRSARK